jgi:O-antigen ligase/polysaccharide polymerase Wzy-like membrane protein
MRTLVEACLVVVSFGAIASLVRERSSSMLNVPLFLGALIAAAGVALGGRYELLLWGAAAVAYSLTALMQAAVHGPSLSRGGASSSRPLVVLTLIVGWLLCVDLTVGGDPSAHLRSYAVVVLAIAGSFLLASTGRMDHAVLARIATLLVGMSDVAGVLHGPSWRSCDQFKCSVVGALYRGPYPSENFLAFLATMSLALSLTSLSGRSRSWALILGGATVLATGSRTALVVCALSVAAFLVLRRRPWTRLGRDSLRYGSLFAFAGGVAGAGIYTLLHASSGLLSNRGEVWREAVAVLHGHQLIGVGLSSYKVLQLQDAVSQHFTQSEYLLLFFGGGYIAVAMFVVWAATTMRAAVRSAGSPIAVIPLGAFIIYGLTEATWNPLAFDSFAWIALGLSLASGSVATAGSRARIRQRALELSTARATNAAAPDRPRWTEGAIGT